jgi:hypothetical protein
MWIAIGVSTCLVASARSFEWTLVASVCTVVLAVVSAFAGITYRLFVLWKGSGRSGRDGGLSGHGRDDDAGAAAEAVYRRRTLAVV